METPTHCTLCPRRCGADRTRTHGLCGGGGMVKIARAALHFWEEPCISGTQGSGTVFFSGCPLQCCYCQNHGISAGRSRHSSPSAIQTAERIIQYTILRLSLHSVAFLSLPQ